MSREKHIEMIMNAKNELKTAGPIHRKDLQRYIKRLEKELLIYDKYHRG